MARPRSASPFRLLAAVLLSLALLVPLGSPAQAAAGDQTKTSKKYGKNAEKKTNKHRKKNDLAKLKADKCLAKWGAKHAKRLAKDGAGIWHQDLGPIMRDCGLRTVGENVAMGYPSSSAVVKGWMNSPGHRANILRPQFKISETVARQSSNGTWYAVQVFGAR